MTIAGNDHAPAQRLERFQRRAVGVRLGSIAAAHRAGVDLHQQIALDRQLDRLALRVEPAAIVGGEHRPALVELRDQTDVPDDVRARGLDRTAQRVEVRPHGAVGVAAVRFGDDALQTRLAVVNAEKAPLAGQEVHRFDHVIVRREIRIRHGGVVLVAQRTLDVPGVLALQAANFRAVRRLGIDRHGGIVVRRVAVVGKAQRVHAQRERGFDHLPRGVRAVGEAGVGV